MLFIIQMAISWVLLSSAVMLIAMGLDGLVNSVFDLEPISAKSLAYYSAAFGGGWIAHMFATKVKE